MENAKKDFLSEFGLEIKPGEVEVGKTYPIFGMITQVLSDEPGEVLVEINYNIVARMSISDPDRISVLKRRAFESGIFISKVVGKEDKVEVECQTVIFGKAQSYSA